MKTLLLISVITVVAACGGGGDGAPGPDRTLKEGLYVGLATSHPDVGIERYSQLVLENGEVWIANDSAADGSPTFFAQGPFTLHSQTFTSTTTDGKTIVDPTSTITTFTNPNALVASNSSVQGTGSVTFVASFSGNLLGNKIESSLFTDKVVRQVVPAMAAAPGNRPTAYDYDKPASIADIVGPWVFSNPGRPVPQATLQVTSSGAINGRNESTGCTYAGTLTPRASGKNVFAAALTVSGCIDAGDYSGVSYTFTGPRPGFTGLMPVFKLFAINKEKTRVVNLQMARGSSDPTLQEGLYLRYPNYFTLFGLSSVLVLESQEAWVLDSGTFGRGTFVFTGTGSVYSESPAFVFTASKALVAINSTGLGELPLTLTGGDGPSASFMRVSVPSHPTTFSSLATAVPSASYEYNRPGSIPDVMGVWKRGNGLRDSLFTIDASGAIQATVSTTLLEECSINGFLTPRASGKNVFSLNVTVTGCPAAGTFSGIAFNFLEPVGMGAESTGPFTVPKLRLMGVDQAHTKMFALDVVR